MLSTKLVSCGSWRRMGRPSVTVLLCLRCGFDLFPFLICSCQVKPGDRAHNQAHYEALGDVITEEVYNQLQIVGGLQRKEVVLGEGSRKGPQSFVFVSPGFQEKERLQVVSKSNGEN